MKTKIVIADDHQLFLDGIKTLLEREGEYEVVGQATTGRELIETILKKKPDVIISDISMPIMNGLEAAAYIKQLNIKAPWIILTMHDSPSLRKEGLSVGIQGFLMKNTSGEKLKECIQHVLRTTVPYYHSMPPLSTKKINVNPLTKREKEIVRLVVDGKTSMLIAQELSLSIKTVETHRKNIYQKLSINSVPQLVAYARAIGL